MQKRLICYLSVSCAPHVEIINAECCTNCMHCKQIRCYINNAFIKISGVPQGSVFRFASISHIYQMIFQIAWCHKPVNDKNVANDTKRYFAHSSAPFARSLSAFCDWSSNW